MPSHSVLSSTGQTVEVEGIAKRLKHTSVSVIKEMMYLGAQEVAKRKDIVSLGVCLPFYPAPDFIHQNAIKILKEKKDIDKYTLLPGLPKLRAIIAKIAPREMGFTVTMDQILVTPGSMAGLLYSFLTLLDPGEEVILPSPYFSSNGEQVTIAGGKTVPVAMKENKTY